MIIPELASYTAQHVAVILGKWFGATGLHFEKEVSEGFEELDLVEELEYERPVLGLDPGVGDRSYDLMVTLFVNEFGL